MKKKGVKIWGLIVILMMFTSLFAAMVSADSISKGNKNQSSATIYEFDNFTEIQGTADNATAGFVSAENPMAESDAVTETPCCNGCTPISGSDDSSTSNSSDNSLSSEIDRLLNANKPVFLFFYTDWCHFCQQQKPVIDDLEQEYADKITFIHANAEENPQAIDKFGVTGFPAMFLIVDKNERGYVNE